MKQDYVVITAVRDEAKHLRLTLESMLRQTQPPAEWIIVDDGSTDDTFAVAQEYAAHHAWIRVVRRANRGYRQSGAGVVEAFYEGFRQLLRKDSAFIVKFDGDLEFGTGYFESLLNRFKSDPRLGIAGGGIFHRDGDRLKLEECPRFHVRGATKVYRRECWEQIGGLLAAPGWDIVDETKASMMGWKTETFTDLVLIHQRLTGTAESKWRDQMKNGRAYYTAGYHPLFMAAKCVYRLASKPYLLGSIAMAYGFLSAYTQRLAHVDDPALIKYVRQQQMRRLRGLQTMWK